MVLIEHLTEHTYHHTHQVICYVMEQFDVKYTIPGMNKWQHHNGFSYKMPIAAILYRLPVSRFEGKVVLLTILALSFIWKNCLFKISSAFILDGKQIDHFMMLRFYMKTVYVNVMRLFDESKPLPLALSVYIPAESKECRYFFNI